MKMIKITVGLLSIVVTVAVIVLLFLLNNLNTVIKDTVENLGPEVTQTAVKLNKVDISLTKSRVMLSGLSVANPEGFDKNTPLLAMQEIALYIDPETLSDKVKVVREITIDGVELIAEHKNIQDTNIEKMIGNIKRSSDLTQGKLTREKKDEKGSQQAAAKKTDDDGIRLMIEKLTFANSSVKLVTVEWGSHSFELPGFSKTMIGNKVEGLTPKQVANEILFAYMLQIRESVKDEVRELTKSKLEKKLEKYKQAIFKKLGIGVDNARENP